MAPSKMYALSESRSCWKVSIIKVPRQTTRDFKSVLKFFGSFYELAELFSCLFCVAASRLNSPRFSLSLIRFGERTCQGWPVAETRGLECLEAALVRPSPDKSGV